jgi:RNA polymerase-binding protein DksA
MKQSSVEHFRALLLKMRKDIMNHMDGIRQEEAETSLKDEDGDNSSIGMHLADQGTDCMSQAQNFLVVEYESRVLYQIDQALQKIENEQYGVCDFCGSDICGNRLEAIPYAALCLKCQEKKEGMYNDSHPDRDFSMADEDMGEYY